MSDKGECYGLNDGLFNCFGLGNRSNLPETQQTEINVLFGTEIQGPGIYRLSPGLMRGKALIVNFEEFASEDYGKREGSQKDVENLHSLFKQMGIIIAIYFNFLFRNQKLLYRISNKNCAHRENGKKWFLKRGYQLFP